MPLSEDNVLREFERIVDFSYHPRKEAFVCRFLSGETITLSVEDIPPPYYAKYAKWNESELNDDQTEIIVPTKRGEKRIPYHIIHSNGTKMGQ